VTEDQPLVRGGRDVYLQHVEGQTQRAVEGITVGRPRRARSGEPRVTDPAHASHHEAGCRRVTHGRQTQDYDRSMQLRVLKAACLAILVVACGSAGTPAAVAPSSSAVITPRDGGAAVPTAGQEPAAGVPWYLTIGDSITYGYNVDIATNGTNFSWARQLEDLLAHGGRAWRPFDTACPGETTLTYFSRCPWRDFVPLLAGRSQHDVALDAIRGHLADLRAILVDLGSNDLIHARRAEHDQSSAFPELRANLVRIVEELKQAAPGVPIVLCNFYDPYENSDPATVPQIEKVNSGMAALASGERLRLADFFAAVNTPTPPAPDLGKYVDLAHHDIHPTVAGHARLAQAALAALTPAAGS
jgi:lysophospholipase L1-like esterase